MAGIPGCGVAREDRGRQGQAEGRTERWGGCMTLSPSPEQAKAIDAIVRWYGQKKGPQEFYLAGYAGVGKSTIANLAIEEIKAKYKVEKVRTAAYTGKAASVLRRKGVEGAQTIHS